MTNSTSYEVIENFLPDDIFYPFALNLMNSYHYTPMDMVTNAEDSDGSLINFGDLFPEKKHPATLMFQTNLFLRYVGKITTSDFWIIHQDGFIKYLEDYLNIKRWWSARVNCTVIQPEQYIGPYHIDFEQPYFKENTTTAILYLNSNNGGTKFEENGEIVQSKKNRLVKFPTTSRHAGVWHTDAKLRFVLNMTYEEK